MATHALLSFAGHAPLLVVLAAVLIDLTHDAARHLSNYRQLATT
jgi:hypothetical protein